MTIRFSARRTILYLSGIIVFLLMILAKQAAIRQARSAEIVSILNEWERDGKPVRVQEVVRRAVAQQVKVTLLPDAAGGWQGYVAQKQRGQLAAGQTVFCETAQGRVLGRLTHVADTITLDKGMYAVKATFDKPVDYAEPGLVAYINVQTIANVIAVDDGILDRGAGAEQFAWVVRDGKAQRVPVLVKRSDGFGVIVSEGLVDGDTLIVAGQTQLQNGDKVHILTPDSEMKLLSP